MKTRPGSFQKATNLTIIFDLLTFMSFKSKQCRDCSHCPDNNGNTDNLNVNFFKFKHFTSDHLFSKIKTLSTSHIVLYLDKVGLKLKTNLI